MILGEHQELNAHDQNKVLRAGLCDRDEMCNRIRLIVTGEYHTQNHGIVYFRRTGSIYSVRAANSGPYTDDL